MFHSLQTLEPGPPGSICRADRRELIEVTPAVGAVEITVFSEDLLAAHGIEEAAGRVGGFAEEDHGSDALAKESSSDFPDEAASKAAAVVLAQQVELVELAGELRKIVVVVALTFGKADELAVVFNDESKPTAVPARESVPPLLFPKRWGGRRLKAGIGLVPCGDVELGQRRDVSFRCIANQHSEAEYILDRLVMGRSGAEVPRVLIRKINPGHAIVLSQLDGVKVGFVGRFNLVKA